MDRKKDGAVQESFYKHSKKAFRPPGGGAGAKNLFLRITIASLWNKFYLGGDLGDDPAGSSAENQNPLMEMA
jgi:hypothetical protein